MGKATIIEAQNSQTIYEEGKNSGILGKLKGIFADYKHGTRNSDRLYTEELWDNRVFGSEDVMEALQTKTLFGELDHPEGDRCETLAKNAAISITKLEKRPQEGVIYGEAEILDTPTGRIVKALADSGAKLGISSRGMGEEIYQNGQNIIDPDTYDFITFDVVVTPANTKARVSLTESKKFDKLTENLKKEITEAETENQLNQIKIAIENVCIENKDELLNLVENKCNEFKQPISTKITEANKQIAIELLKEKYANIKVQLDESINASNTLADENKKLIEERDFLQASREMLQTKLKENINKVNENNMLVETAQKQVEDDLTKKIENLEKEKQELNESKEQEINKYKQLLLQSNQVANKKVENIENKLKEQITKLEESNKLKDTQITKLQEANRHNETKVNEYSKILVENKKLLDRVKILEQKDITNQNKLEENKKLENNEILKLKNRLAELETTNSKLQEAQNRFSKLSFNPIGTVTAIAENFNDSDMDPEDLALYNALIGN